MSKASPARVKRQTAKKAAAKAANENQPETVDINNATPQQLRAHIFQLQSVVDVMRDEATLGAKQLTEARAIMRQQTYQIQLLAKRLGGTPPKKK